MLALSAVGVRGVAALATRLSPLASRLSPQMSTAASANAEQKERAATHPRLTVKTGKPSLAVETRVTARVL